MEAALAVVVRLLSVSADSSPAPFAKDGETALKTFCNDPTCLLLRVAFDGRQLWASNEAAGGAEWPAGAPEAFLTKLRPCIVDAATISSDVVATSAPKSALEALFATLHSVYLPKLLKEGARAGVGDDKVRTLLTELDRNLASALRSAGGAGRADVGAGILGVADEYRYWSDASKAGGREAERAAVFAAALEPVAPRFERLAASSLPQLLELVEDTQVALDSLWRSRLPVGERFPQPRMKRLLFLIGSTLASHLQARLGGGSDATGGPAAAAGGAAAAASSGSSSSSTDGDVWRLPPADARAMLRDATRTCEAWMSATETLTGSLWTAASDDRPWAGEGPFADGIVRALRERIAGVARIRLALDEAAGLLPAEALREGGVTAAVAALRRRNAVSPSATPQDDFDALARAFERGMEALEPRLADALRREFAAAGESPQLLVAEAGKFPSTLRRPRVRRALTAEREAILAQFSAELSGLEGDLTARSAALRAAGGSRRGGSASSGGGFAGAGRVGSLLRGRNESAAVADIAWADTARARVRALSGAATGLLSDLRAFKECLDMGRDLGDALARYQSDVFAGWCEAAESALRAGSLSLDAAGRVVDFDRDGNIVVRYSEGLVVLVRDVRQLAEKGFAVPSRIRSAAGEAEALYRFGVQLQKVASCYNTLGSEIIAQQKPMLLEPLLAFERLVQESAGAAASGAAAPGGRPGGAAAPAAAAVTWADPKRCSEFVEALQRAADRVAGQNRRLRGVHARLAEEVASLMGIDMIKEREAWRGRWVALKEFVVTVCRGFTPEQTGRWLGHWDLQLYKALEAGYRMGLEALNESLTDIRVDLALALPPPGSGQSSSGSSAAAGAGAAANANANAGATSVSASSLLVFRPTLEELRAAYYKEMRRFIGAPAAFEGLTGTPAPSPVFAPMVTRNAASLLQVYRKAEILFARLAMLRDRLRPWAALAAVDADAFVEARVRSVAEFEANFQVLRARRREADRLPDVQRVDCVTVNLAPFKAGLDAVFTHVTDALLLALRRILLEAARKVEIYLENGIEAMTVKPSSLSDIAKAQRTWRELSEARPGMRSLSTQCEEQRRLLGSMAAGALDLSDVNARLGRVLAQWDSFDASLEAFTSMAEEQRGTLRSNVSGEVKEAQAAIERFASRWAACKPREMKSWSSEDVASVFASLDDWKRQLDEVRQTVAQVQESCESFGLAPPQFEALTAAEADLADTTAAWDRFREYNSERAALAGQDWITFRSRVFELQDFAGKWAEVAASTLAASAAASSGGSSSVGVGGRPKSGAPAAGGAAAAAAAGRDIALLRMAEETEAIRRAFNALKFARGEPFREEHWTALFKKLGMPKTVRLENLTVAHFLDVLEPLAAQGAWLKDLHARAQGEVTIREALQEVKGWTDTAEFKLMEHVSGASGRKTSLIREWKDLFTAIGDNQSLLASLKDSPYFKPFADTAAVFESNFATLDECCQKLNAIQRRWVYLEPVLSRGALPSEQARFKRVDDEYRDIMGRISADPRVASLADASAFPGLKDSLATMLDQLERCQRALADFLEERRARFPRFYFLGDDDLLEILGQSQNPAVIQSHLKKLYQGVYKVEFAAGSSAAGGAGAGGKAPVSSIVAMCSAAGEVVRLAEPVPVTEDVTVWLNRFSNEMVRTLADALVACLRSSEPWQVRTARFPSQISCLAEQIRFCAEAEAALAAGGGKALTDLKGRLEAQLAAYTALDASSDALLGLKVKALVMDAIHHLDVCDQLLSKDVKDAGSWLWQKQLRFYLDERTGRAIARMVDAVVDYTYEYQGNSGKLVHTPLTDKCYMVLTQGIAQGLGGNPYGPAGTGKTESVKALGAAIGRQVLVFNCDEAFDLGAMGRIFMGIVKCGAWGCFDEFNRLKEDQLSAISQQIQTIQAAIRERKPSIALLGQEVTVNFSAGIFVTLNPAGKGYGGRSKLPDNLKQLFRPVAMTKPDNELIAEVILYSEGFRSAKDLARKVVSIFTLSGELLSKCQHYEWGLRPLKTVLNTGGSLLQKMMGERSAAAAAGAGAGAAAAPAGVVALSPEEEREVLIKAIRVNTLSKLTFEDSQRFLGLMADVFPGARSEDMRSAQLEAAIREVMASKAFGLEFDEGQLRKMLQLKEALDQRIGCLVVGPSGCGKSTLWRVLQAALVKCGQSIVTHVMNPKAMPRARLLGEMDHDTREWTDGVLTAAARAVVKEPLEVRSWIVCDGDVDPEWIEALNSVLDDNHLLTLPNGERIAFGSNVNFLFETHDLQYASPATISRMGLIYMSDDDVDVRRVVTRWLRSQPEEAQAPLGSLIETLFHRALDWVRRPPRPPVVETTLVGAVTNALSHLAGAVNKGDFAVGLIRGFGANFDLDTRAAFAREVFTWAGERPVDPSAPLDCYSEGGVLKPFTPGRRPTPAGGDAGAGGAGAGAGGSAGDGGADGPRTPADVLSGVVVPTVSLQRTAAVLAPWMERMEPFILVGPEGAGKSTLIRYLVEQRRSASMTYLHCNAQTSAEHVIQKIRQLCVLQSSTAGRVFRPREGERLVLFLKDINLPKPDRYGTCALVAFLQQLLTFHGFYDENREFLGLERVHIVASMNPSTTIGRHPLSPRFTATVRLAYMDYPDPRELAAIYGAYMAAAFGPASGIRLADDRFRGAAALHKLAATMVEVHAGVLQRFSVDEQRHYLFTPRDLTSWVRGLMRYPLEEEQLLEVLAYEAARVYRDRLVDADAAAKFDAGLAAALRSTWGFNPDLRDVLYTSLAHVTRGGAAGAGGAAGSAAAGSAAGKGGVSARGGSSSAAAAADASVGAPLSRIGAPDLRALVERGVTVFEREERDLGLILFPEVLDRIACVDRILTAAGGCALLVGRSGVGRRSAASLVAHMRGMSLVSPAVGRSYGVKTFFADLKGVLATAGVAGEDVVLYLEDHHFADGEVLESVNSLLASGEVPGLYSHEELEPLLAPLKEQIGEAGFAFRSPYEFFLHRIRRHLHVAVGMDPSHPDFLPRCERNPALYTRCALVWMGSWRRASVQEAVAASLSDVLDASALVPREVLVDLVSNVHAHAAATLERGAAPRDLMALLRAYRGVCASKAGGSRSEVARLRAGLGRLEEAQSAVDAMTRTASSQREELRIKQAAADRAMSDITDALGLASDRKKEVEVLSDRLAVAEGETRARKAAVESELAGVMPMIEAAKAAVGGISKGHIDEIKNLRAPPEAVADVLSAVLTLMGVADTSFSGMKKFLGERGVKDSIIGYDARRMTAKQRAAVSKILREKGSSFEKDVITRVSFAAAPMAEWVKAVLSYAETLENIAPLEGELAAATRALEESQAALDSNKRELAEVDARVRALRDDFGARTAEAEVLKAALARTEDTLNRAQALLGELAGERDRWGSRVEELSRSGASLPLHALLGAGFITYLGGASEDVRAAALREWQRMAADAVATAAAKVGSSGQGGKAMLSLRAIAATLNPAAAAGGFDGAGGAVGSSGSSSSGRFDVVRFLASESDVLSWKAQGLPSDGLSVENATVILHAGHAARVPFIIDPSTQATAWLQRTLSGGGGGSGAAAAAGASSGAGAVPAPPAGAAAGAASGGGSALEVLTAQDPRFQNAVELAVRFGKTLLIRDVDRVDAMLYPLLRRDYTHAGPRNTVAVGDKLVDVNEGFRLFFATRNPRPFIPPDAASLITEVNFTVTRSGLESQLLGVTLQHERPELESRKSALLAREEELKLQLVSVEEALLQALASSQGNLLEDKALLESLAQAKAKASEISLSLEGSEAAARELDAQRDVYRPFAGAGSTLFFVLRDLASINAMYQYSLSFFLDLFRGALGAGAEAGAGSGSAPASPSALAARSRRFGGDGAAAGAGAAAEGKGGDDDGMHGGGKDGEEGDGGDASARSFAAAAAVSERPRRAATPEAIAGLVRELEVRVLRAVGASLLKADRTMFAMHLVHAMRPHLFADRASGGPASSAGGDADASAGAGASSAAAISQGWRVLMGDIVVPGGSAGAGGQAGADDGDSPREGSALPRGFPLWAPRDRVPHFRALEAALPDVVRSLALSESDRWGRWAASPQPEREFPPHAMAAASPFQRLLLVHALRPDRALSAMQAFLLDALGLTSLNPPPPSMHRLAEESGAAAGAAGGVPPPILMVTGAGADPSRDLSDFAASAVGADAYREVAMGGGVHEEALRLLRAAARDGHWLCLKNLHLVVGWLPVLEKELAALKPHPSFRLWLTTECHPAFPAVLLQSSLKVTFEAPPGVRKNLERTLESWGPETLCRGGPLRAQLLFALAWLHAVVQERRTYEPQGWTKSYEFSAADLRAGAAVIDTQLARAGGDRVPWAFLHGLVENTVYGGRVDAPADLRVLRAYLATVLHPDVLRGTRPLARGVPLPATGVYDDYAAVVASLPETDAPYLFSLPDNIERSLQRVVAGKVVAALKSLRALGSAGGAFARDKWRAQLAPLLGLWERLVSGPLASVLAGAAAGGAGKSKPGGSSSSAGAVAAAAAAEPVVAFVGVELALAGRLAAAVAADLTALQRVLVGGGLLTPAVLACGLTLLSDAVPDHWRGEWEGPESPMQWLSGLAARCGALSRWQAACAAGGARALLTAPLQLNDLFRPATFLNALRQQTARLHAAAGGAGGGGNAGRAPLSMDALRLVCAWDASALAAAPLKATVSGLLLQGATFGGGAMQDVGADAPEVQGMPDVTLAWMPPDFPDPVPAAGALTVPVYASLDRTAFVMELSLPCRGDKAKWVLAGVALFLSAL